MGNLYVSYQNGNFESEFSPLKVGSAVAAFRVLLCDV